MQFFLDTANLDEIKKATDMGILDGVTTNPTLIAKENYSYQVRLEEICQIVNGPVSAQITATEFHQMVEQGLNFSKIAKNISTSKIISQLISVTTLEQILP